MDEKNAELEPRSGREASDLSALLSAVFPRTIYRLKKLDELKQRIERVALKYRMFGQTNFGATGDQLAMIHFGLAMEFEELRYWWMRPIKPLKPIGR
jgi:hypothetical protein